MRPRYQESVAFKARVLFACIFDSWVGISCGMCKELP